MGWFWDSPSSSASPKAGDSDPVRSLDPSLRSFLEASTPQNTPSSSSSTNSTINPSSQTPSTQSSPQPDSVPNPASQQPPTLFPDGRYASLWASYTPLSTIVDSSKTEQEKLLDVLETHAWRKSEIARAALENCANEQIALTDCYQNGSWMKKMTLCRQEDASLRRCYLMQQKFLKALGYLAHFDASTSNQDSSQQQRNERIQMHADTLYHRMLHEEAVAEKAKADGVPVPPPAPLIELKDTPAATIMIHPADRSSTRDTALLSTSAMFDTSGSSPETTPASIESTQEMLSRLSDEQRAAFEKQMEKVAPIEREIEERAFVAEMVLAEKLGRVVNERRQAQMDERLRRRETGQAGVGDKFSGWFGW